MKVAFFKTPVSVELREVERPKPAGNEVLVRVLASGICGSDLYAYSQQRADYHRRGHEYAGVVEQIGSNITKFEPGDLVAGIGSLPCGDCVNCRKDKPEYCLTPKWCGGGAFAEYVYKEEEFFMGVPGLNAEEASLMEPLTVAIDMVNDGAVSTSYKVAIIGAGPIGLMALRLCKSVGASKVYVSHPSTSTARLQAAFELGADEVICPDKEDLAERMRQIEPEGVDSILITTKISTTLQQATELAAVGGTIAFVGMEWEPRTQLNRNSP